MFSDPTKLYQECKAIMFGGVAADLTLLKDIQLLDMLTCFLEYGIHCVTQCIRYQIGTIRIDCPAQSMDPQIAQ